MIALYLIAAHLVGDFVLQTRWQAVSKFSDPWIRMRHVDAYVVPFLPIVVWRCWGNGEGWHAGRGAAFMVALYVLHFLTDSRRFTSTLGDWLVWRLREPIPNSAADPQRVPATTDAEILKVLRAPLYLPLTPNPWPPIAILIDQTLHVCQLAVLAGLFLT